MHQGICIKCPKGRRSDLMAGDLDSSESRFAPPEGNGDGTAAAVEPQVLAPMAFRMPRHALLELPYTAAADPEIESDIRTLLEQITSSVVADLQPAAILVRGSLGRGEGAAFRADRETQVTSDVELVAVL